MDIVPEDVVLSKRGISTEMYAEIVKNVFFSKVLTEAKALWASATNTPDRIKIEAAALLEDWLPDLYVQMNNAETPLSARIEGGKLLARLAGVGEHAVQGTNTDKFVIQINLGDSQKGLASPEVVTISPEVKVPLTIEAPHAATVTNRRDTAKDDPSS